MRWVGACDFFGCSVAGVLHSREYERNRPLREHQTLLQDGEAGFWDTAYSHQPKEFFGRKSFTTLPPLYWEQRAHWTATRIDYSSGQRDFHHYSLTTRATAPTTARKHYHHSCEPRTLGATPAKQSAVPSACASTSLPCLPLPLSSCQARSENPTCDVLASQAATQDIQRIRLAIGSSLWAHCKSRRSSLRFHRDRCICLHCGYA